MNNPLHEVFSPSVRRWLYLTLVALVPVATLYGWVNEVQAGAWIGVVGAVLGLGTAAANTPTPEYTPVHNSVDNASV